MPKHYVGMAGLHGCMPSMCNSYPTIAAAAESLGQTHESAWVTRELKRHHYVELIPVRYGNEYAEIIECDCADPTSHDDS